MASPPGDASLRHREFRLEGWTIRPDLHRLIGGGGEQQVHPKAMEVLVVLAEHAGDVVSRDHFLSTVWGDSFVSDQVLANAVWELRRAFGDDPRAPRFIATVPKRGYRLLPAVVLTAGGSDPGDGPAPADGAAAAARPASSVQPPGESRTAEDAEPPAEVVVAEVAARPAPRRWPAVAALGVLSAALIALLASRPPEPGAEIRSAEGEALVVAILPFENSTGAEDLDWLATAIPDVLTHELASSRHLYVLDALRPAGESYGRDADPSRRADLARRQGARVLVSGRVTGDARALRVLGRFDAPDGDPRLFEVSAPDARRLFQKLAAQLRLALEIEAADVDPAAISATGTSSIDAYRHYIQGVRLARRQDYGGALAELHAAVELDPDFALAHGELAHVYDVRGEDSLALEAVGRALGLADDRPKAERIGFLRLRARIAGDVEEELDYLRQMVALRPRDARWIATLGWFQFTHFRQCDEATVRYRSALELDPRPDLYAYLGEASLACGRPADALAALGEAVAIAPDNAEAWRFLAYVRSLTGDVDGAFAALDRAAELAPARASVAHTRALLLADRRRYGEALEALRRFRGLGSGINLERESWVAEADIYRSLGELDAAARAARRAVELGPEVPGPAPRALWISGLVAIDAGEVALAEARLDALDRHFEGRVSRYGAELRDHLRGAILARRGEPRAAADAFADALGWKPVEQARFRLPLARAWLDAGDAEAAAGVLYRLLEIQPNHAEARCLAAEAHRRERRPEAAALEQRACDDLRSQLAQPLSSSGEAEKSSSPASAGRP